MVSVEISGDTRKPVAALEPPEPDAEQVERFTRGMYKHATVGTNVSIRAFLPEDEGRALYVRTFGVTKDLKHLIKGAINNAREAAKCGAVFSPPLCTFTTQYYAREVDIAEGLAMSVDCDKQYPRQALETLSALLGAPTFVVASGGRWLNPDTREHEDKLHLHWRLAVPARDVEMLKKLKHARMLAAVIVGADTSNVPINHPIRWAGSWHLKAEPRLCRIVEDNDTEIDLDAAFDALKAAAPADVEAPVYGGEVSFEKAPKKERNHYQEFAAGGRGGSSGRINTEMLVELMPFCPNNDFEYGDWNAHGMAIWRAVGAPESREAFDLGLKLFDDFSKQSAAKYDQRKTARRWYAYKYSPPTRTGGNKLAKIARANGWTTKPTHKATKGFLLSDARTATSRYVNHFLYANHSPYMTFGYRFSIWPTVYAAKIATGIGKTTTIIKALAEFDAELFRAIAGDPGNEIKLANLFHYGVPTHKLANEVGAKMQASGLNVRVAHGRSEENCDAFDKVKLAVSEKVPVTESCCKNGDDICPFFETCAYQGQWRDTGALEGWIYPHDFLFHENEALGTPDYVILDESFWSKQIKGVESDGIELPIGFAGKALAKILDAQEDDGPLRLDWAIYAEHLLDDLIQDLWDELSKVTVPFQPSGDVKQLKALFKKYGSEMKRIARIRVEVRVLEELREMINNSYEESGRLLLKTDDDGVRLITWRGVDAIKTQFQRRTLILDATLPSLEILRVPHPQVRIVADIHVDYDPAVVQVRQVTDAPVSKSKLVEGKSASKHQESIRRYTIRRWFETGRGKALVICNKAVEEALTGKLPKEIALAHFNSISGLDTFGDIRLLIIVGRPMPRPASVESRAAALSGRMPQTVSDPDEDEDDNRWYPQVRRGIRMRDGTGIAVRADEHPDPLCESIRYQTCEAEIMQCIGRGRGVNRNASTPLDIDVLNDCALPHTIDRHDVWDKETLHSACIENGVMLETPDHMLKVWPSLWPNVKAASPERTGAVPTIPGFERFRYRLKGKNQQWRFGWFNRSIVADPCGWIEQRLGPATVEANP